MEKGLDDFGALLLQMYRLSHELPVDAFQDAALGALQQVLPFDSSMWGSATFTPAGIDVHTIHLFRQSPDMLAAYDQVKHLDTAAAAVACHPTKTLAFDASAWFSDASQQPIRDYGARFRQKHFFISSKLEIRTQFVQWFTLFRANASVHCTERERHLVEQVSPHFLQALGYNRARHVEQLQLGNTAGLWQGAAVADLRGVVYHATPAFDSLLRSNGDQRLGARLPEPMMDCFRRNQLRYNGRTLVAECEVQGGLLFVKVRPRCAADQLSGREWEVGRLVAKGFSYKEIAQQMNRAPATVRNHIQAIYRKLEVGSIAELIHELQIAGG